MENTIDSLELNALEGKYVNYFKVGHNAFEFVFDFGQSYSEQQEPRIYTRIITSPCYAEVFLKVLQEAVDQYQQSKEINNERLDHNQRT